MPLTAKQIEKLIKKDGWKLIGQNGSHRQYKHDSKPGKVTIPWHKNGKADLRLPTEKSIKRQAGI
jgi:predicted RNA binding protein YcfA (HicA-like mRNA interferase family)